VPLQIFRNGPQNLLLLGRLTTRGAFPHLYPHQGLCPWTPLGAHSPQTPIIGSRSRARHPAPPEMKSCVRPWRRTGVTGDVVGGVEPNILYLLYLVDRWKRACTRSHLGLVSRDRSCLASRDLSCLMSCDMTTTSTSQSQSAGGASARSTH